MNLYLISQKENSDYDTYDSAIVCTEDESEARETHPFGKDWADPYSGWAARPEGVTVKLIGRASEHCKRGLVLASFNAG